VSGDLVVVQGCSAAHVLSLADGHVVATAAHLRNALGVSDDRLFGTLEKAPLEGSQGSDVVGSLVGYPVSKGASKLQVRLGADAPESAAVTARGLLLVDEADSALRVIHGSGSQSRIPLPSARDATLSGAGDLAVVATSDGSITGVDLSAMRPRWRAMATQVAGRFATRVIAARTAVVATLAPTGPNQPGSPEVVAVDPATGNVLWRASARLAMAASRAQTVLVSQGSLEVRDTHTGQLMWSRNAALPRDLTPVSIGDGRLPIVLADGALAVSGEVIGQPARTVGLDSATGTVLWTSDTLRLRTFDQADDPESANGELLPVTVDDQALADARTARILWRAPGQTTLPKTGGALVAAALDRDFEITVDGDAPPHDACP
jgi:outer membrane protein assembly factor BamB